MDTSNRRGRPVLRTTLQSAAALGALAVLAVLTWQGVAARGTPDPLAPNGTLAAAVLNTAVLVFREGLECVLVLAAITANMGTGAPDHRRPIAAGVAVGLLATVATWMAAVGLVDDLTKSVPALQIQAATGLLAVCVLLLVMNWFFHKVYWTGWIAVHNRKKRELLASSVTRAGRQSRLHLGLAALGFTAVYREGFEVVLFLQSYRLKLGQSVLYGLALGLFLTAIVSVLTFQAHRKLPYKRMLVLTGVLLTVVLVVMVGEQVQEMQLAQWVSTTDIGSLGHVVPSWVGTWFAIFPTVETLTGQLLAITLVLGSYALASRQVPRAEA